MRSHYILTKAEEKKIEAAISDAEKVTSGEIRIHIERSCRVDSFARAVYLFNRLKMYKTERRNAVLIYMAYRSRKLVIIGDSGINEVVPENFWQSVTDRLLSFIKEERYAEGLLDTVSAIGLNLSRYFPYEEGDTNEQSNTISYGDKV